MRRGAEPRLRRGGILDHARLDGFRRCNGDDGFSGAGHESGEEVIEAAELSLRTCDNMTVSISVRVTLGRARLTSFPLSSALNRSYDANLTQLLTAFPTTTGGAPA